MGSKLSCCTAPATPRVAPKKRSKRSKGNSNHSVVLERTGSVDEDDRPLECPVSVSRRSSSRDVYHLQHHLPELPGVLSATSCNLQHISEREPDDIDCDPSSNPTTGPLFMQRSRNDLDRSLKEHRKSQVIFMESQHLKKFSSCSTIFVDDSTVCHPNLRNVIKSVSLAIYCHIESSMSTLENHHHHRHHHHSRHTSRGSSVSTTSNGGNSKIFEIFDERLHPLSKDCWELKPPDHRTIYRFMRTLFNAAQLPPECAIITLVYIERLMTFAEMEMDTYSWKRIVLGAILLASKVWDDQAVWNVDYCQILRDIPVEDMNDLERRFLELLQFNINVPQSVYAKYYFDLRHLSDQSDMTFLLEPLTKERALKMEAMSKTPDDKPYDLITLRKWMSLESLITVSRTRAVLS